MAALTPALRLPRLKRSEVVTIYDAVARPAVLPLAWRLGSAVDRAHSYPIYSQSHLYETLEQHLAEVGPIRGLSSWSHGVPRGVLYDNEVLHPGLLAQVPGLTANLQWAWLRACDTFKRHSTAKLWADTLRCIVFGHCEVISGSQPILGGRLRVPAPWFQGSVVGLRPGASPTWDPRGAGLPGCMATRMRPRSEWIA